MHHGGLWAAPRIPEPSSNVLEPARGTRRHTASLSHCHFLYRTLHRHQGTPRGPLGADSQAASALLLNDSPGMDSKYLLRGINMSSSHFPPMIHAEAAGGRETNHPPLRTRFPHCSHR